MSDYYIMVLHQEERVVYITFAVVCLTFPTIGAVFGGWLSHKIGGLASSHAYASTFIFGFISCILSLELPLQDDFWIVTAIFASNLFCGGVITVLMYGMILNSL